MAKFRKKPVVIEAVQWFKDGDHPAVVRKTDPHRYADEGLPWVPTLEGGHVVTPGDWIITGVAGEHYPCKPEIFAQTYEPADGVNAPAEIDRDTDGELLIDWSPSPGRMVTLSLRADGRLSYAITWDGEKSHGTAQMPAGVAPTAPPSELHSILEFLYGAAPLDGCWFGDGCQPTGQGRYWWRSRLRAALAAHGVRVVGHACKLDGSICESRPDRCSNCPAAGGGS
jgi:hypothetical protein